LACPGFRITLPDTVDASTACIVVKDQAGDKCETNKLDIIGIPLNANDSTEETVVNGCAVSDFHIFPSYRLRSCKKGVNSMQGT
jgi:hypothetical protein